MRSFMPVAGGIALLGAVALVSLLIVAPAVGEGSETLFLAPGISTAQHETASTIFKSSGTEVKISGAVMATTGGGSPCVWDAFYYDSCTGSNWHPAPGIWFGVVGNPAIGPFQPAAGKIPVFRADHTYTFNSTLAGHLFLWAVPVGQPATYNRGGKWSGGFKVTLGSSPACGSASSGLSERPPRGSPTARFGPVSVYGHVPGLRVVRRGGVWVISGVKVAHLHDRWTLDDCGGLGEIEHVRASNVVNDGRPVASVGDTGFAPATSHGCPSDPLAARGQIVSGNPHIAINGRPVAVPGSKILTGPVCGSNEGHIE